MIILFKYYDNMENCESFRGFGYIYRLGTNRAMHGIVYIISYHRIYYILI